MSTLNVANIQSTGSGAPEFKNSSGTEIGQIIKAWVVFDGSGTVSIDNDFNVSTVADTNTGRFTVNFTTAFTNANYVAAGCAGNDGTTGSGRDITRDGVWTTSACQLRETYSGSTVIDDPYISVMFIGE